MMRRRSNRFVYIQILVSMFSYTCLLFILSPWFSEKPSAKNETP